MNYERRVMLGKPSKDSFKDEWNLVRQVRAKVARIA
jgi:hypothetical protein